VSIEWTALVWSIKGVYVQLIRSTTRRYFRGWQNGPAWKCIYTKNKSRKNARNHGYL